MGNYARRGQLRIGQVASAGTSPANGVLERMLQGKSARGTDEEASLELPQSMIEVEKKFDVPPDIGARVVRAGGHVREAVVITDAYWDFALDTHASGSAALSAQPPPNYLALRDCWLRYREVQGSNGPSEGLWEIKMPISELEEVKRVGGESITYREVTGKAAVAVELSKLIGWIAPSDPCADWNPSLRAAGLEPFAEFSTKRSKFSIMVAQDGVS